VPRSNRLETKKQEVPDDILVVVVHLVQTGHDVQNAQLLLSVLKQRDERPFAAITELLASDGDVEPLLPQHGRPGGANSTFSSS